MQLIVDLPVGEKHFRSIEVEGVHIGEGVPHFGLSDIVFALGYGLSVSHCNIKSYYKIKGNQE